ncbi:hypothetical protein ASE73_04015 [Sphingomonas sp. Leaf24]|uniref:hypothetical protein n=1 Tax=unclassified Sphingomonas TaxID=196159 RepID=UPI0006F1C8E1|nr:MULTISPECIES: hypothetical protein [unclassified Sphingomonas]KQM19929.1 hypothetical protein ASE50_03650 [Sphingomonas sp. Leaf5]KQM90930.1 hypothetical protein ASE73_04015 [Sphingomonas sp. Leaf24]
MRACAWVAALCLSAATPAVAEQPADTVQVVLKFVKRGSADAPVARFDPASCRACTVVTTPLYAAENARETVIALAVPRRRSLELRFTGPADAVRRVVLESGDVPFVRSGGATIVQLPPLAHDAITAAEVTTHIVEPGMVLRFEHAVPQRRAGAYATGRFPETERRAADVLEFAQREVIRTLGLGEEAERRDFGRIQVMGFDTNAPHGHVDAPPHVHMHLRWPRNTGTQIGHYYLGPDGLLTHNGVGVKGLPGNGHRYGRGETFTTIAPDGSDFYFHRITPEGWLEIGRPDGRACLIRPAGVGGFQDGGLIRCGTDAPRGVRVTDDLARGVITATTGDIVETFRYDPDTGLLTSPDTPPPMTPSNFVPE